MTTQHEGSGFVRHIPCDSCGSRDNAGIYTDGHTYCFGCGAHTNGDGTPRSPKKGGRVSGDLISDGLEVRGLRNRNITDETCKHFGYACGTLKGSDVQVAPYFDADGKLVAQKVRFKNKDFKVLGSLDTALPFGAHAFPKTGKMIVVTEGEIDALSMSQVQGNKYPVVSIACGAGPQIRKYIAKHREYLAGFDKVVLMFDSDEPGREASKVAAEVIGRRACIAELPLKDANEMLKAGRTEDLLNAMWRAKEYRPEGIVDMATLKEKAKERPRLGLPWWLPSLTSKTYGIRTGEIYAFGAGTGVGKTDFFTQEMVDLVVTHQQSIGVFSLEQQVTETATRIAGKQAKRPLHIPDCWDEAVFDKSWDDVTKGPAKVFLYDSFGANDWSVIKDKVEYLAQAEGVRYFFLDHLTALAAEAEDERIELEKIMSEMGSLVKRLDVALFLVSHLATPEKGPSHEEGGRVTIRHFKGSRAIGFWSHFMFGLERNQQAENEAERTTTTLRILKDRYTGRGTGQVMFLGYEQNTGMLFETTAPEERSAEAHGFTAENEAPQAGDF